MECFVKIVNSFAKPSILDVWQGSEYTSGYKQREKELDFVENMEKSLLKTPYFKRRNETKTEKDHN